MIDLPLVPPRGSFDAPAGADLSVGLPYQPAFDAPGAASPIPGPGALSLLGLGSLALLGRRRR
jgi:uncharacterized protein (TIGR03382 family)